MKNKRFAKLLTAGILVYFATFVLGITVGESFISPMRVFKILFGNETGVQANILLYSRLPRTLAALLAGGALSVSGAVLQTVLSNKLASPTVIGVNAGAGLGVTVCCAFGLISGWAVSAFAFAFSLCAVLIISFFASRTGASKTTVILGGVALNGILGAVNEAIAVIDPDVAILSSDFRVGGFSSVSPSRLFPAGVIIILSMIVLFTLFNELDVVGLGDETAANLGLSVKKYRIIFLILSSLAAGAAVSFSGLLGFVGLIVPHFIRLTVGSESRYIIPLSFLFGGAFICLCDTVTRLIFMPYEMPAGILTALIGGPLFVFILIKSKGGRFNCSK